jgi:transcriptional repressor NF-X1
MALDLDPEREGTPAYSDETIAAYNRDPKWASAIEAKFRAFVTADSQKRLQFAPMRASMREFLHLLSTDYGLDSESQDPEPYRSVVVRKPANFVAAPKKTLAEVAGAKPAATTPAALQQLKKIVRGNAANAFVLKGIRVGVLASELEKELAPTLKESQLRFDISWYGDEDVLLKPRASSLAVEQMEAELHALSTKLKRAVAVKGLAEAAELCWVGQDGRIANRDAAGWSVSRKTAPAASWSAGPSTLASRNGFDVFSAAGGSSAQVIAGAKKKSKENLKKEVVEDWEMEADTEEGMEE